MPFLRHLWVLHTLMHEYDMLLDDVEMPISMRAMELLERVRGKNEKFTCDNFNLDMTICVCFTIVHKLYTGTDYHMSDIADLLIKYRRSITDKKTLAIRLVQREYEVITAVSGKLYITGMLTPDFDKIWLNKEFYELWRYDILGDSTARDGPSAQEMTKQIYLNKECFYLCEIVHAFTYWRDRQFMFKENHQLAVSLKELHDDWATFCGNCTVLSQTCTWYCMEKFGAVAQYNLPHHVEKIMPAVSFSFMAVKILGGLRLLFVTDSNAIVEKFTAAKQIVEQWPEGLPVADYQNHFSDMKFLLYTERYLNFAIPALKRMGFDDEPYQAFLEATDPFVELITKDFKCVVPEKTVQL